MRNIISATNINFVEIILGKLYALWLREFKVFLRERSRLVASIFTPLLWLFVIGSGFGSAVHPSTGVDYQMFIFPGIISMSIIFSSVFFGSYIIWDRKFDFLKSVMVAPVGRNTIFVGKTLGGMTTSLVEVVILLAVGAAIGIHFTALSLVQTIAIVLLLSFWISGSGPVASPRISRQSKIQNRKPKMALRAGENGHPLVQAGDEGLRACRPQLGAPWPRLGSTCSSRPIPTRLS